MIQVPQNDEHKEARYTRFWNTHFEQDRLQLFVLFYLFFELYTCFEIQIFFHGTDKTKLHFYIANFNVVDFQFVKGFITII